MLLLQFFFWLLDERDYERHTMGYIVVSIAISRIFSIGIDIKRARDIEIPVVWPWIINILFVVLLVLLYVKLPWFYFIFPLSFTILAFYVQLTLAPRAYTPNEKHFWSKLNLWYAFFQYEGTLNRRQFFLCRLLLALVLSTWVPLVNEFQSQKVQKIKYLSSSTSYRYAYAVTQKDIQKIKQELIREVDEIRREASEELFFFSLMVTFLTLALHVGCDAKRLQDMGVRTRTISIVMFGLFAFTLMEYKFPIYGNCPGMASGGIMFLYSLCLMLVSGSPHNKVISSVKL